MILIRATVALLLVAAFAASNVVLAEENDPSRDGLHGFYDEHEIVARENAINGAVSKLTRVIDVLFGGEQVADSNEDSGSGRDGKYGFYDEHELHDRISYVDKLVGKLENAFGGVLHGDPNSNLDEELLELSCLDKDAKIAEVAIQSILTGKKVNKDDEALNLPEECAQFEAEQEEEESESVLANIESGVKELLPKPEKEHKVEPVKQPEKKAIDYDRIAVKFHYEKGLEYLEERKYEEAEESFTKSIEAAPTAAAHRLRAAMLLKKGNLKDALIDLEACIKLEPEEPSHYITRGVAMQLAGDNEGAVKDYTVAVNLSPDSPRLLANRGLAMMRLGRYDEAVEDLDKAIEIWPEYAEGLYNRGVIKQNLKDFEGAVDDYSRALELKPDWKDVRHNLNVVLAKMSAQ